MDWKPGALPSVSVPLVNHGMEDTNAVLFTFGVFGMDDGQFNYPNDIVLDLFGRLYIADRENNRIQVWSY